jgi:hypothetical protein
MSVRPRLVSRATGGIRRLPDTSDPLLWRPHEPCGRATCCCRVEKLRIVVRCGEAELRALVLGRCKGLERHQVQAHSVLE